MRHKKVLLIHWTHHCSLHSQPSVCLLKRNDGRMETLRDDQTLETDKMLASTIFWDLAKRKEQCASASLSPPNNRPDWCYRSSLLGNRNQVMAWRLTINCLYSLIEVTISVTFPWGNLGRLEMYQHPPQVMEFQIKAGNFFLVLFSLFPAIFSLYPLSPSFLDPMHFCS